ncbi:hypothetical protein K474DRAFT_1664760 [Panus rudis PR-1116 ss-1]|nr:hypothetical protein K474DRAFT_1664760 [Panus rudis PR-1116 ss-1]
MVIYGLFLPLFLILLLYLALLPRPTLVAVPFAHLSCFYHRLQSSETYPPSSPQPS